MMKEKKKDSFFHKFIDSIKNKEKYPELAIKSYGEVLLYIIKLLLIFVLVISIAYTFKISSELKKITNFVFDEIPDFTLEEGLLSVKDNEIIIKENISENVGLVILDTNSNIDSDLLEKYKKDLLNKENGIVLLKDKFLIKTMVTDGVLEYKYLEFDESVGANKFTKQELVNYFSGKNLVLIYFAIFITTYIYMFIFYSISILLDIILLVILGYISTLFMRMRIRFNALFKMAIHSLTLPIILNIIVVLIQLFTPFRVKYIVIAYIYMIAAISIIRIDIIKNKQELLNIMEEQKRVKEELDRQEDEEKRKKEESKEDKKEEKDEDKKEEKNEDKDTPQGEGT